MTSLDELRAIQQQRIADERNAFERERAAELEARRAAEQALIDAEQARLQAERDHQRQIEDARLAAEREARLRVEAAEATERARLQAALEEQRLHQEMELRRAEVAKKRPTWMLAVTGLALCAGLALSAFAIHSGHDAEAANQAQLDAQHQRDEAVREARESAAELEKIRQGLDALDAKVKAAEEAVRTAQRDVDRQRALAALADANRQKDAENRRLADEKAKHDAWVRAHAFDHQCLDTAVGCISH